MRRREFIALVGRAGSKPEDFPVEQTSQYQLIINLKTSKALGITVPPTRCSPAPTR
jgi:putative tryptophan/tyrosine transport system substrate-binding protein